MLKRILIVLGIIAVLGSAYWWFDGPRVKPVLESHYMGLKNPTLNLVPTKVNEPWMARQPMTRLRYSGYEFQIPWDFADEKVIDILENKVIIHFSSGHDIAFSVISSRQLVNKVLSSADTDGIFPQILGEDVLQSDYTLTKKILETTPGKASLLSPRKEAITVRDLLALKQSEMPAGDSGLFTYEFGGYRCFQFGNPDSRPRSFSVILYSKGNTVSLEFTQAPDSSPSPLSQADVDSIVRSVHKVGNGSVELLRGAVQEAQ